VSEFGRQLADLVMTPQSPEPETPPALPPGTPEMKPYDPTIRERMSSGLQSGLEKLGMDRYKARQRAQTVMGGPSSALPIGGVADFLPFVGTALQTQEAVRGGEAAMQSAREGDYIGAGVEGAFAALSMVPGAVATTKAVRAMRAKQAADKAVTSELRDLLGMPDKPKMAAGGEVRMQGGGNAAQIQAQLAAGVPVQMSRGPEGDIARQMIFEEEDARRRAEAERQAKMQAKPFGEKLRGGIEAGQTIQSIIGRSLASPFVALAQGEDAAKKFAQEVVLPESEYGIYALGRTGEALEPIGRAIERAKIPDVPFLPEVGASYIPGLGRQLAEIAGKAARNVDAAIPAELKNLPVGASIQPVGQTTEQWLKSLEKPPKPAGSKMEVFAPADDLGLYSKMEKAALNFKRKEGTGDAWLADFKNAGVSDEELEYSGMKDILAGITKPRSRETIATYARQNRMPLQAVRATEGSDVRDFKFSAAEVIDNNDYIKSRAADIENEFEDYYPGGIDGLRENVMRNFTDQELKDPNILASIDETVEANKKQKAYDLAYTEYYNDPYYRSFNNAGYEIVGSNDTGYTVQTPNGEYLKERSQTGDLQIRFFKNIESAEGFANQHAMDMGLMKQNSTQYSKYQLDRGGDYEEMKIILPQPTGKRSFHGDHWDEEDVLSHYRTQVREDTEGKRMLYVDEVQSDWHQAGRDNGYFMKEDQAKFELASKKLKDISSKHDQIVKNLREVYLSLEPEYKKQNALPNYISVPFVDIRKAFRDHPEVKKLNEELDELENSKEEVRKGFKEWQNKVPDAPFKDTWHELTVKAVLHDAAQKGFDRVGFSSAKPHIDRYGTDVFAWEKVPEGWKIVSTEQRGGQAAGVNIEAEARARGILKSRDGDVVKTRDDLKRIVELTLRDPTELKVERITNKVWKSMNKNDVGIHEPRKEGMLYFYDEALKKYLEKYAKKLGGNFYETETLTGYGASDKGPVPIKEKVYMFEFTPKAKDSAIKGQPYKKGGAVNNRKVTFTDNLDVMRLAIGGSLKEKGKQKAKEALKEAFTPKQVEKTAEKMADKIKKENPKLTDEQVMVKAKKEAEKKLQWEKVEKPALEKIYGPLEKAPYSATLSQRQKNVPEVVEKRIKETKRFLAQPTEPWTPPRKELQAFDRTLIKDAMEGFPGVEQTRFPRYSPPRSDLSYIEEIYGDPVNRSLIEGQIKRGLPLGGETFYASLYPLKVAALERGIPEEKFNQFVYSIAPASARNSIFNEMAVGQFLRDMQARGLPLDEATVTREMAKFKEKYGTGLPLMPVHREGVKNVLEGNQDLRELLKADIPTNYKIPTYGTQKAGDFGQSMVLDVHEAAGQTRGSRYHPYFTEQGGFGPTEYGAAESQMLDIAQGLGLPGGTAQAGRWFGGGELTGLKSPRGDALDLLERQAAYTLSQSGIDPTPRNIRNTLLDMIETGQGLLMPYFKKGAMPDLRVEKKKGGAVKKRKVKISNSSDAHMLAFLKSKG